MIITKGSMGILSKLFGRKEVMPVMDMARLKVDMHSHLIPGIDDGAETVEASIELIESLHEMGYTKLITTPHIMSDYYKNDSTIINAGLETMRAELRKRNIPVELEAAAEYYMDYEFESKVDARDLMTFGNNYVLFEISFINEPEQLDSVIFKMRTAGYTPVLAHVERYPFWYANPEQYEKLAVGGVLLQLNISSLSGQYGPPAMKMGRQLIDNNMIDLLGTDCHNMNYIEMLRLALTDPHLHKVINSGKLVNAGL